MKEAHDKRAGNVIEFNPGDKVLLDGRNISTTRPTKKFEDKWYGPFDIVKKVGAAAYKLKLPTSWKQIHPVFNGVLLKKYVEPSFESQKKPSPPPPVLIDNVEEYEVKEILDSRIHRRKLQYLVKWVGYDDTTWEPASEIERNAKETVQDFYRRHPGAPRQVKPSIRAIFVEALTTGEGYQGWSGRPTLKGG